MEQLYKPKYTENFGSYGEPTSYGVEYGSWQTSDEENYYRYNTETEIRTKTNTYKATWEKDGERTTHLKIKDDEGNFEGLLAILDKKTLFTRNYVYEHTIYNIYTGDKWIFKMLEDSGQSVAQINLIKYMLYEFFLSFYGIAEDYGVTEPPSFDELFAPQVSFDSTNNAGNIAYSTIEINNEELAYLCCTADGERGDGTETQIGYVASVILNRVLISAYSNTIKGVVTAEAQFDGYSSEKYNYYYNYINNGTVSGLSQERMDKVISACKKVIESGDTAQGATYFMTPLAAESSSWLSNCIYLFNDTGEEYRYSGEHGTHNFYALQEHLDELAQYKTSAGGSVAGFIYCNTVVPFEDLYKEHYLQTESEYHEYTELACGQIALVYAKKIIGEDYPSLENMNYEYSGSYGNHSLNYGFTDENCGSAQGIWERAKENSGQTTKKGH